MAAPTLQAQGATIANTTGTLTVVLPAHQADDILLLNLVFYGPNSTLPVATPPAPSGWTVITNVLNAGETGISAWFWKRAASGSESNPVCSRGSLWDTGTDTCFGGRAYNIRGCVTSGDPWDAVATAGDYTTADQAFPAVTVSGPQRTVIIFGSSQDNAAFAMTSTGWTTGTEDDDATGTDCAFQTARKENVSSDTAADTGTVAAPQQGSYAYCGISFKSPSGMTLALSDALTLVDNRTNLTGKVLTETLVLVDTINKLISQVRSEVIVLADAIETIIQVTTYGRPTRLTPHSLLLINPMSAGNNYTLNLTETVSMVDSRNQMTGKVTVEAILLQDAILRSISQIKSETVSLVDAILKSTSVVKNESVTLADTVEKVLVIVRTFNEVLSLVDSVVKQAQLTKTETIVLAESVIKNIAVIKSETAVLVDTLRRATSTTKSEILTLTDVLQTVLVIVRTFTETVILVDTLRKQTNLTKQEAVLLNDSLLRSTQKRLSETAVLTDFIQKLIAMQKLEGVILSDTLTTILAGVVEAVLIELLSAAVGLASAINTSDIKPASDIGSGMVKPAGELENPAIEA